MYWRRITNKENQDLFLTKQKKNRSNGDRYVNCFQLWEILKVDANNLYGWAMSQLLPYKVITFDPQVNLKEFLERDDFAATGYFV